MKLSEVLREIHECFVGAPLCYGHGTDNAWDEAVALVLGVSGLPDTQSSLNAPIPESVANTIREVARRRVVERQPLPHLLGKAPYCGEVLHVPLGIVVPRSPIGPLLAQGGLRPWVREPGHILDLCCGSGCLGILAAKCFPGARVLLADIDPLAVDTARRNLVEHGLGQRVDVVSSDLFDALKPSAHQADDGGFRNSGAKDSQANLEAIGTGQSSGGSENGDAGSVSEPPAPTATASGGPANGDAGWEGRAFDLILCNPPYVDADSMAVLPPEFAHEPVLGLDGGIDGLAPINRVIGAVSDYLAEDGVLVGEVGAGRERLESQWRHLPFIWPDLPDGGDGVFLLLAADAPRSVPGA